MSARIFAVFVTAALAGCSSSQVCVGGLSSNGVACPAPDAVDIVIDNSAVFFNTDSGTILGGLLRPPVKVFAKGSIFSASTTSAYLAFARCT